MQREIAEAAFRFQQEVDSGERTVVGVNGFGAGETQAIPILAMDPQGYDRQVARLHRVRAERDSATVEAALRRLVDAARDGKTNLMYPILEAVSAYATLGEITGVFRQVFGSTRSRCFSDDRSGISAFGCAGAVSETSW